MEQQVHVGDQVDLLLKPKLFFAVVRNVQTGSVFTSMETMRYMTEFDLENFPNGLEVTLTQSAGGGEYTFTGRNVTYLS